MESNLEKVSVAEGVYYVGADDKTIDLFESQYRVPNGISYNSYVILDEKVAVMDTVDRRASEQWLANLELVLEGRQPDYLIVSHMEPDHAANIQRLAEKYPKMQVVGNAKTFSFISQYFEMDLSDRSVSVKEGDTLSLGTHTLQFFLAPMVHWPEVMVTYEQSQKILFSADAFGKFGTLDTVEPWEEEGRRYYLNIVGKYGMQVQMLLKKAANLDIAMICPLHGPVLKEDLAYYIGKYARWSSYEPEEEGVFVAYASIHGNTKAAVWKLARILEENGAGKVVVCDLAREDGAQALANAFRYDRLLLACPTYDGGLFPPMEAFLQHLKAKNFQKRKVAVMENGTWAPMAAKLIKGLLETMKEITVCENVVSLRSVYRETDRDAMERLAQELLAD